MDGFLWTSPSGQEKWATVRYERLSEFCFGCGRLGHTAQSCNEEIAVSERKPNFPKFGPWLIGERPKMNIRTSHVGTQRGLPLPRRDPSKKSWRDMMQEASTSSADTEVLGVSSSGSWSGRDYRSGGRWRSAINRPDGFGEANNEGVVSSQSIVAQGGTVPGVKAANLLFNFDLNSIPEEIEAAQVEEAGMDLGSDLGLALGEVEETAGVETWVGRSQNDNNVQKGKHVVGERAPSSAMVVSQGMGLPSSTSVPTLFQPANLNQPLFTSPVTPSSASHTITPPQAILLPNTAMQQPYSLATALTQPHTCHTATPPPYPCHQPPNIHSVTLPLPPATLPLPPATLPQSVTSHPLPLTLNSAILPTYQSASQPTSSSAIILPHQPAHHPSNLLLCHTPPIPPSLPQPPSLARHPKNV